MTVTKAKILNMLSRLSMKYPELRLMQIIANALGHGDFYYITDDRVLQLLELFETWSDTNPPVVDFVTFCEENLNDTHST